MTGPELRAHVDVETRPLGASVDPMIYGHFLESAFFGNIEGGLYDEGSPLSYDDGPLAGCRSDVLEACRELGIPVLRWPGGNFTSAYWWQDGIGPRADRPRRFELAWGSEESNHFGTPEFLAWCEAVGAEPYLAHNCRSVEDAVRWVEYTNYAGTTDFARARRDDGRDEPWGVRIWGLGNEVYGPWQVAHRSAAQYVVDARQHAQFMRAVDPGLKFVAVGSPQDEWTDTVVAGLGGVADWFSLHLYAASEHLMTPTVEEFDACVGQPAFFERTIHDYARRIAELADKHGLDRPPAIAMDEWNIRHVEPASWSEPKPGEDGGTAERELPGDPWEGGSLRVNRYGSRTLADALFYAGVFHTLHRAAGLTVPVTMANTVNLINANGLINVRPHGMVRTASYHVWDLYLNHFGRTPTRSTVETPARFSAARTSDEQRGPDGRSLGLPTAIPYLDVSSARDGERLTVAAINRSADSPITVSLTLDGRSGLPGTATVRELGGASVDLFAANRIGDEPVVTLSAPYQVSLESGQVTLAPRSITLLTLEV